MKIILNTRLLLLLCFVSGIASIASCKKDKDVNSGRVELLSFGPTGTQHGDTLSFIGNNLNKVTAIDLQGASITQSAFIQQTSELILIIIPVAAEEGYVTLKTPEGDITSKTILNFEVPVTITSFTSAAKPGDNITITGQYLNWVTEIRFAKDVVTTEFVSQSLTELVVKVPMEAQTGTIVISTGGTEPLTIETEDELTLTLPVLTDFMPNPVERGSNLTITGADLDLTMGVLLKGLTEPITSFVSKSATELVVTIPDEANKGKITLVAYSGVTVESEKSLLFVGDLPDLDPLSYAMYVDNLENGWQNWGWGGSIDLTNTDNVRDGDASMKRVFDGSWGALSLHNDAGVATGAYNEVVFSIFGTPGTGGKTIKVMANWGGENIITVEEGKWVEFKITKAAFGNPGTINDLILQEMGWSGTVYIDHIGLR